MLLRYGKRYAGKISWTAAHEGYLASLSFTYHAQVMAFLEYRQAVSEAHARAQRLSEALIQELEHWRMRPLVHALMTLRGVDQLVAITLVAELGNFKRFGHPRDLMGYLGLVPSEHIGGEQRRLGAITKTGNSHARQVLIEAAVGPHAQRPQRSHSMRKSARNSRAQLARAGHISP